MPKLKIIITAVLVLGNPLTTIANSFDPNLLISDERFADTNTLGGAEGIQKFLESKGSVLANTSPDFLTKLREPGDEKLKISLGDPRPSLGRLRTAAELIYDASLRAGLNPQVVLITANKEQGLITSKFASESELRHALDNALGFGCREETGCTNFTGFYSQLFGYIDAQGNRYIGMSASLMRSFYFEVGGVRVGRGPAVDAAGNAFGNGSRARVSRRGDTITVENTQGPPNYALATQSVTLSNFATTALYRYTPHVYNGNYNFYRFLNAWFRYPNGALLQAAGDSKIYAIDNGLRRQISSFVINQRGLNPAAVIPVSAGELAEFSLGDVMVPSDGTLIRGSDSQVYLIEAGTRKRLSSFVATQRRLNLASAVALPEEEIQSYKDGGLALPSEGTLVKSRDNPAVFVIESNQKRLLTVFVFKNRGYSFGNVLTAEPGELEAYPTGPLMPPQDGTILKKASHPTVYHIGNGIAEPLTYFVFTARKFSFKDMMVVPDEEFFWEIGKPMPPPTGLLVKGKDSPAVYYTEGGLRRWVSYDTFRVHRFSFRNVLAAEEDQLAHVELGQPLRFPERALVKTADNATVYYVVDGVLRPLTLTAFKNRLLRFEDVVIISTEELANYEIGPIVEN